MPPDDDAIIEAVAPAAAAQARRDFRRELRLAEQADRVAAAVGAGRAGNSVATALADAYLAAREWTRPGPRRRDAEGTRQRSTLDRRRR